MSGSKIKGGGRAILSKESQEAVVDLLMTLDSNGSDDDRSRGGGDDAAEQPSAHDKKRLRKKFTKRLIARHERRELRRKFNVAGGPNRGDRGEERNNSSAGIPKQATARSSSSSSTPTTGGNANNANVRVELVEAIFKGGGGSGSGSSSDRKDKRDKKDKKKAGGGGGGKKSSADKGGGVDFKAGAKKVVVLPRTTTVADLAKLSKSKLKLKKTPVRAFVRGGDDGGGRLQFDLESDLAAIEDGTVVYVSATPAPKKGGGNSNGSDAPDVDAVDEDEDDVDPLDSVKRAYRLQEEASTRGRTTRSQHRRAPSERADEVVDEAKRSSFAEIRSGLPVSSRERTILDAVGGSPVVVLSGATGSGKSTQVPQFLLEEEGGNDRHRRRRRRRPYVVVTQPRRVAAISLAQRVAEERGCPPPGAPGGSVGYMVRGDRRVDLRSCRIVYMTIGILLRMLVNRRGSSSSSSSGESDDGATDDGGGEGEDDVGDHDAVPPLSIDTISHLVIDETHERDANTDFALTLLKGALSSGASYMPRLILMSATASTDAFVSYFTVRGVVPVSVDVPGRTFPVDCRWLPECEKFVGGAMTARPRGGDDDRGEGSGGGSGGGNNDDGIRLSPRATGAIDNGFIRSLIAKIVKEQRAGGGPPDDAANRGRAGAGAILVFLPGLGEIESLARCLCEDGTTVLGDRRLCKIAKLHSTIAGAEQRRAFEPAPRGGVKIVLSSNIAETSVTIPDVTHVIDTCRVKESRYNPSTRIKELVTVWTSRASMKQRAGRAGRTSRGVCWRLCTEEFANGEMLPHTVPEMARTPLDELILQIGLLYEQRRDDHDGGRRESGGGDDDKRPAFAPGFRPIKFLSMTPTPPAERSLVQACQHLLEVEALKVVDYGPSACDQLGWLYRLTPLGYHLSRLPMDAKVGKMLIVGCLLGCLDNALTIAAALSCTKSCFLFSSQTRRLDPNCVEARDLLIENGFGGKDWSGGTVKGDLIAVICAYRAWRLEKKGRDSFCRSHALNSSVLRDMDSLRNQFFNLMVDAGLVSSSGGNNNSPDADDCNIAIEDALLTSCCIVGGLYPNICTLIRPTGPKGGGPKGGRLLTNDSSATCRPSSNSFQRRRVQDASQSGKDAYAVFHSKHRNLGAVSSGQKRPPETFLSEVNFVSKFALLLFGGELELVKNAIIVDKWLKFKVSSDEESVKQNAILILSLRELLDKVILEHVVETFSSPGERAKMVVRHKRIIQVVRKVLADEG